MKGVVPADGRPNVAWARYYANLGWAVFPVHIPTEAGCSCGRVECDSPGKHPRTRNGHVEATTEPDQIHQWWEQWPEANVGIATGKQSNLVVVDEDPRNGGDAGLADLEDEHGRLPDTWICETGGGGRHYFFRHPGGRIPCSSGKLAPGVDIKGDGGYVVATPSLHASGERYAWSHDGLPGGEDDLAPTPDWIQSGINGRRSASQGDPGERIRQGERNQRLASIAGSLRHQGLGSEAIHAALLGINENQCDPRLPKEEVRGIAKSIGRYPPGEVADSWKPQAEDQRFLQCSERLSDLMGRKIEPPRSLVGEGLILVGFLAVIFGRPGLGKTWLALQLLLAVARGFSWLGIPTQQARCGFLSLELRSFFVQSRMCVLTENDEDGVEAVDVVARPELKGPVDLSQAEQVTGIIAWCRENRIELLVIDPFSRASHVDENAAKEVADVLANLERIAQTGVAVVLIHHERKAPPGARNADDDLDALRGSSRLQSDPVTAMRLKEARSCLVLTLAKANHATNADPQEVWLQQAEVGGYEAVEAPPKPQQVGARNREAIRSALTAAGNRGCTREELEEAAGIKKNAVLTHLNALEAVKGEDGRYRLSEDGEETSGEAA
jgi:hypothetical protein